MSFGDPNNPYAQQPGQPGQEGQPQQQPGYGYPQGQQPPAQPGYGYPQAPPVQPYGGGGYPTGPTEMPGGVKAVRVFLWVLAGLSLIGTFIFLGLAATLNAVKDNSELKDNSQFQSVVDQSGGKLWACGLIALVWVIASIILAVKLKNGGSGLRTALIVYGALTIVLGVYPFGIVAGIVHIVLGILAIVFVAKSDGAAWFKGAQQQH
jgi:hypothetical protein